MKKKIIKLIVIVGLVLSIYSLCRVGVEFNWLKLDNTNNLDKENFGFIEQYERYKDVKWKKIELVGNVKVEGIYEIPEYVEYAELIEYAEGFKKTNTDFLINLNKKVEVINEKINILFP